MKQLDWMQRPRESKLANVLYPNLSDEATQRELDEISHSEGKKSPMAAHNEQLRPNQGKTWWSK